tara:strand:- start:795 stop:974 length:180 start_codon:yes stop_codon:yes gene_type:complete
MLNNGHMHGIVLKQGEMGTRVVITKVPEYWQYDEDLRLDKYYMRYGGILIGGDTEVIKK